MKEINRELLNARMQDMTSKISNAMLIERLAEQGDTPESIVSQVKDFLGLDGSESVLANAQTKATKINVMASSLIQLNGVRVKLHNLGLGLDEDGALGRVENALASNIMELYGIDEEDLYE